MTVGANAETVAAKAAGRRDRGCLCRARARARAVPVEVYHLPRVETCSRRRREKLVTLSGEREGGLQIGNWGRSSDLAADLASGTPLGSQTKTAGTGGGVGGLTERVVFAASGGLVEQRDGRAGGGAGPVATELEGIELEGRAGVGVGGGTRVKEDREGRSAGELAARKMVFDKAGGFSGGFGGHRVIADVGRAGGANGVEGELRGVAVEPEGVRCVGGVGGGAHEEGEELDGAREGDGDKQLWAKVGAEDGVGLEPGGLGLEEARKLVLRVAEVVGGEAGGVNAVVERLGHGGGDGRVAMRVCMGVGVGVGVIVVGVVVLGGLVCTVHCE